MKQFYENYPNTPYHDINDVVAMIHKREDIPNFMYPESLTYNLEGKTMMGLRIHLVPKLKEFNDELRSFPIAVRKCIFEEESTSLLFPVYSQQNCAYECAVNQVIAQCACVPWYVPWYKNISKCEVIGKLTLITLYM